MFTRLGDTYRRIRNTLRILLGNLYDFESGNPENRKGLTLIDRWILERLDEVIRNCRAAYENFEFHKVYHTLNQFCAVDLSSLYIDITKDRMYCDAPDSPRRRATQTVMHEIFDALCRLLAPVLAFTAEEAWRYSVPPDRDSVHLQEFPEPRGRGHEATGQVDELLRLRGVIGQGIERARQEKLIGNTLEARVVLNSDSNVTESQEELEEFFIVSDLTIHQAKEASASVTKTQYQKCARCWRHRPTVGTSKAHPDLCDRCESVVDKMTKSE
jgi:isoleucyl-tRNA synthetase